MSDHADPINLEVPEAGLTDLFAFPDGDQMVVILCCRPNLTTPPPYQLEPFEYTIFMDLHTKVTNDNAQDRARYGGTIVNPEGIKPDVTIKIRLKNDATLNNVTYEGLRNPHSIRLWTGVRDDPFILPRFFKKNVIAMVLSIPFSAFPEGQQDWLLWATSTRLKDGVQIDHDGRSNRSQQARFQFLNTLAPSQHVEAIKAQNQTRERIEKFLMKYFPALVNVFQPLLKIRHYDYFPDVMIYTKQYPIGFPNGRYLTDDVALLTGLPGDCALLEGSYIDSPQWPRATVNDKPFLKGFPYLAEPWPATAAQVPEEIGIFDALAALRDIVVFSASLINKRTWALIMMILVAVVILLVMVIWLLIR